MLHNRILGMVFGAAIGDALGSAFEFMSSADIHRAIGSTLVNDYLPALPGSLMYPREPGIPTDDTAMALALVHALDTGEPSPEHVANTFRTMLARDGRFGPLFWNGGPGGSCLEMLEQLDAGRKPYEHISSHSGGNGSAMRTYPCAIFPDEQPVVDLAAMQGQLSHRHPGAVVGVRALVVALHQALYLGKLSREISPRVIDGSVRAAWERAHADRPHTPELPPHLLDVDMAGWETVAAAHAIAIAFERDPERAIGLAAASGKDTDTVASITGALAGAVNGYGSLPQRWIDGIAIRDELEEAAAILTRLACTP